MAASDSDSSDLRKKRRLRHGKDRKRRHRQSSRPESESDSKQGSPRRGSGRSSEEAHKRKRESRRRNDYSSSVKEFKTGRGEEIAKKCSHFRYFMLYTSGGWLGDLLITLTDLTGIWEFTFLIILFIISWIILRISQIEITLILGHIFDLIIPLQHQIDSNKQLAHLNHLEQYWPIFLIGLIIEFSSFILVHPDLFTLIACVETLILTTLWLGRDKNGKFLTEKFGGKKVKSSGNGNGDLLDRPRSNRDNDGRSNEPDNLKRKKNRHNDDTGNRSNNPNQERDTDRNDLSNNNKNDDGDSESKKDGTGLNKPAETKSDDDTTAGVKGKHPYDSRGFDGNLMPIRKKLPNGPEKRRKSRRG
ncbi:uncharacterized protein I206_100112 [Kwoniella pini CBS 10737]|uniref:Uncharacterized protein n=1 Tax=Kwoniella pini CBS 10737 TaxID=1296096 RepID=A0A1B9IDX5_9TREE|nr:uncharacterized protein I206_01215 [Kwoniella pini CBS 10737]OCF53908.1 hypothetical protein I206_01215 [Kwoniella pini CBS 10737]